MVELLVDDLFVVDVDKRGEVDRRDADKGEAPERHELHQKVGDEGDEECLRTLDCEV